MQIHSIVRGACRISFCFFSLSFLSSLSKAPVCIISRVFRVYFFICRKEWCRRERDREKKELFPKYVSEVRVNFVVLIQYTITQIHYEANMKKERKKEKKNEQNFR